MISHRTQPTEQRRLFDAFAPGVPYISVEDDAQQSIGSCFHIGENIFVTARHVVAGRSVREFGTTNINVRMDRYGNSSCTYPPGKSSNFSGPFYHPNPDVDLVAFRVSDLPAAQIPLFTGLEDPYRNRFFLESVLVLGYPPISGSKQPVLVAVTGEINCAFDSYIDHQLHYVVSCMDRGGFSGGPAIVSPHFCIGMVTASAVNDPHPAEIGFMTILGPLLILEMLDEHKLMPADLRTSLWEPYQKSLKDRVRR